MPRIKSRNKSGMIKIWRPNGMKYGSGEAKSGMRSPRTTPYGGVWAAGKSTEEAVAKFQQEFGYIPAMYAVEIIVEGGDARATVYDISEEPDDA